jgi:hypothetical protein
MKKLAPGAVGILRRNWLFVLIVGALAAAFLVLRTPGSAVGSMAEVDAILTSGQPTLVEIYSNT